MTRYPVLSPWTPEHLAELHRLYNMEPIRTNPEIALELGRRPLSIVNKIRHETRLGKIRPRERGRCLSLGVTLPLPQDGGPFLRGAFGDSRWEAAAERAMRRIREELAAFRAR